ncbi:MAG: metalloregulator ArsR/SmtB family transcription factor [Fibrobacteria bacterium]
MKSHSVDVFQALADPTRRSILQILMKRESSIRSIAESFPQNRNAIVKHLAVLKAAALVEAKPEGRETVHKFLPGPLDDVKKWLAYFDVFWDGKLADLKQAAESLPERNGPQRKTAVRRKRIR